MEEELGSATLECKLSVPNAWASTTNQGVNPEGFHSKTMLLKFTIYFQANAG